MSKSSRHAMILAALAVLGVGGALLATQMGDRIESSAKESYVFLTYLTGDDIRIQTSKDNVVTLTGTVSEWSHRSMAQETVAGLPGVVRVDNKLVVKGGQPAENSDTWIGMKVKTMLMFHRNVSALRTDVGVNAGVVTLHGEASSEAQKELATEYAKDVEGVQGVVNDMAVDKDMRTAAQKVSEYVDDASITAQVRLALLFHRSTSVIKTRVETTDGVVTVSGVAENSAERDLVGKLVVNIRGVKGLKNEMTLA